MTNIDIAIGMVFQALRVKKDSFDSRIISQKKIFLLQEMGIDIGYSYNWYIRGPYSPDLANYIYDNLDMLKDHDFSAYKLSNAAKGAIDTINDLEETKPQNLTVVSWYELLASVLYIIRKWNKENPYETLIKYKPKYTKTDYDAAIIQLRKIGCCQ
jgi:uncharacterized protein YwgA